MARKKNKPELEPEPEPEPIAPKSKAKSKWEKGKRPVRFAEGNFTYLGRTTFQSAKFRAVFEDDPVKGCYGFGNTKESARAMLYDYAEDNEEDF